MALDVQQGSGGTPGGGEGCGGMFGLQRSRVALPGSCGGVALQGSGGGSAAAAVVAEPPQLAGELQSCLASMRGWVDLLHRHKEAVSGLVNKLQGDMVRAQGLARSAAAEVSGQAPPSTSGGCSGGAAGNGTTPPTPAPLVMAGAAHAAAAVAEAHAPEFPAAGAVGAGQGPTGGADQVDLGLNALVQQLMATESGHWLAKVLARAAAGDTAPLSRMHALALTAQQQQGQQEPPAQQGQPGQGGRRGFKPFQPPSTAFASASLQRLHSQHQQVPAPAWDRLGLSATATAAGSTAPSPSATHPHPELPPLPHPEVHPVPSVCPHRPCSFLACHPATTRHACTPAQATRPMSATPSG